MTSTPDVPKQLQTIFIVKYSFFVHINLIAVITF